MIPDPAPDARPATGRTGVAAGHGSPAPADRVPKIVGLVWMLLLVNTLGYTTVDLIIPLPRGLAQVITMGSLAVAFAIALVLNPRVRVQPSPYLFLLSMLALASLISSAQLESGLGSLMRCGRMFVFVATLWLLSCWWRGGLLFARLHLKALTVVLLSVLLGLVASPGSAFSGPDGRLVGAIWPIPAPQVGQYCAVAIGLILVLWFNKRVDGPSVVAVVPPAVLMLLLSHTRTALMGLVASVLLVGVSLVVTSERARRSLVIGVTTAVLFGLIFSQAIQTWLVRGQDAEELSNFTGRAKVWDLLLAKERSLGEELFGVGLTDKSFAGLPIDNSWLAIYHEQGWIGVGLVVAFLLYLLGAVALRPSSPPRACAVLLISYCLSASYTEVGLGDVSPYLLHLAVAASLLTRPAPAVSPGTAWPHATGQKRVAA